MKSTWKIQGVIVSFEPFRYKWHSSLIGLELLGIGTVLLCAQAPPCGSLDFTLLLCISFCLLLGPGMSPETGTIAYVASALAMALIGAVSSYISYQQKKFCFRIQRKWICPVAS